MSTTELSPPSAAEPRRSRRPRLLAAAAAVVALGVGTAVALSSTGGTATPVGPRTPPTTTALTVPGGLSMGSCAPFDVTFLRDMPVALAGTVVSADPAKVTLDVQRWYKGGSTDQVTIAVPEGQTSAALDGVDFQPGGRYLLTATDGTVNGCGFSGPATPELEKAYNEAFPG